MQGFEIVSPVDGSVYAKREYASQRQINETLEKAGGIQNRWKKTELAIRQECCRQVVSYLENNVDELAVELSWLMGRPVKYTPFEIVGGFKERALHMIDIAERALSTRKPPDQNGISRYIDRTPLGTVLILSPWNYPYLTTVNALIPAILAGNTVILKHADQTALVAERLFDAFSNSSVPEGVFQYLHLTHDQTAQLIKNPIIKGVAFTGSVEGGQAVQMAAQHSFIPVGLELGGKDAAYVREDANLSFAVENIVDGCFFNSGQSCCAIERVYVHEKVYEDFVKEFIELTKQYVVGNPLDRGTTLGPLVRKAASAKVHEQIREALEKGAQGLISESDFSPMSSPYMAPQILTEVNHGMQIMKAETFGPVAPIMKVQHDDEAVALINDSQYGLTASIWTSDKAKAAELGEAIDVGTVFMNRCDYLDPNLAWTGVKASGRGCTLSEFGFDQFTRPKSFHLREI